MQPSVIEHIKMHIKAAQKRRDDAEIALRDLKDQLAKAKAAEPFCEAITACFTARIGEIGANGVTKKRRRDAWYSCVRHAVPGTSYCALHHRANPKKLAKGIAIKESGAPEIAHPACKQCGASRGARIDYGTFGSGLCVPCRKGRYNA